MSAPLFLAELSTTIRRCWRADTSSDPAGWTAENPAWGQCAVTALLVQDHFGGDLMRGVVGGSSHYWNRLADGQEIDLTLEQFRGLQPYDQRVKPREYVLGFSETQRRYDRLKERLWEELGREILDAPTGTV